MSLLMRGLHGQPVRVLQMMLGEFADGVFGQKTEDALKRYQAQHGLVADGIAGPDTFTQMGLHELVLLQVGTKGTTVKKLQEGLGLPADGDFGAHTEGAVKKVQEDKQLEIDGVAGPQTLQHVPGFGQMTKDKVDASLVTPQTPEVDPAAIAAAAQEAAPAAAAVVSAASESKVARVGASIWSTIKKIV
jgi:peptidoglycan hydrolase-like protein with peptidoglycan-binding domain